MAVTVVQLCRDGIWRRLPLWKAPQPILRGVAGQGRRKGGM